MSFRALISETIDPDGALCGWLSPDVRGLGWRVWRLPTQEAVHVLGPSELANLTIDVVRDLRPHVVLVHPPYDHLPPSTCAAIRALGARLVGLGFDDPLFDWDEAAFTDLRARFDLWATTTLRGRTAQAGAVPIRWALAPEHVADDDPAAPLHEVLLVGRRTPQREAVVAAIEAAGLDLGVYGAGWPNGAVPRARMLGMLRRARVVVTPSDGVDMLKARFLEAAMVGARQVVEWASDLDAYFPEGGGPPTWRTPEECAALCRTAVAPCDVAAHTWTARWPELVAHLQLADLPARAGRSPTLERLYATLAHGFEARGNDRAARAFFHEWRHASGSAAGALAGLARCAYRADDPAAATLAAEALERTEVAPATRDHTMWIPAHTQGAGLGQTGALDPTVELEAVRLMALVESGGIAEATSLASALPARRRRAVAAALSPDEDPDHAAFWAALSSPVAPPGPPHGPKEQRARAIGEPERAIAQGELPVQVEHGGQGDSRDS